MIEKSEQVGLSVDAIGVGAGKTATTWVYACLDEHPAASVPAMGETDFFTRHYYKGSNWYASLFEDASDKRTKKVDISPTYLIDPGAPGRIHDWNPDARLLFSLRNPVERAYSHYCMHLRAGKVSNDVDAEIAPNTRYMREGLYFEHIKRFLRFFPREQMLFLLYDDLQSEPEAYLRRVYEFVGVDPSFRPTLLEKSYHARKARPRFQRLYNVLVAAQSWVRRTARVKAFTQLIKYVRRTGAIDTFHRLNEGKSFPQLSPSRRREMAAYYEGDVRALSAWLGRDLSGWLDAER